MNYYERHIGDYLKDTAHLSLLEHGIYSRLLDVYYTRECGLEDSTTARLIGARSKEERGALESVLNEFFVLEAGIWTHRRCDREIARYQDKQRKASASANARWSKQESQTERNAGAMRSHTEGNAPSNQTPDTSNQKEEKTARKRAAPAAPPPGVDPQVWADWLQLRKAKRAPVTQTVVDGAAAEAVKAGLSLESFLRIWCRRGSQGLEAGWLKQAERESAAASESPYARRMRQQYESFAPEIAAKRPSSETPFTVDMEPKNVIALR